MQFMGIKVKYSKPPKRPKNRYHHTMISPLSITSSDEDKYKRNKAAMIKIKIKIAQF